MASNFVSKFPTSRRAPLVLSLPGAETRAAVPVLNIPRTPDAAKTLPVVLPAISWRNAGTATFAERTHPKSFPLSFGRSRLLSEMEGLISAKISSKDPGTQVREGFFLYLGLIERLDAALAAQVGRYASRLSEQALLGLLVLISEETALEGGKIFPQQFLAFLKILLPPLPPETQSIAENVTSLWLESYASMWAAKLIDRRSYFLDWRNRFFRNAAEGAVLMVEEFVLFGKLATAANQEGQTPKMLGTRGFLQKPMLVNRSRNALINIEWQMSARTHPSPALDHLLQEAADLCSQAQHWGITNFEYHFLGPALPPEWVDRLTQNFAGYPIRIYQYPGGIAAPQLVFESSKAQDEDRFSSWTEEQIRLRQQLLVLDARDRKIFLRDLRSIPASGDPRTVEEACATWFTALSPEKQRHWLDSNHQNLGATLWLRIGLRLAELSEEAVSGLASLLQESGKNSLNSKKSFLGNLLGLLFPASNTPQHSKGELAELWLSSYEALRRLNVQEINRYCLNWLERLFFQTNEFHKILQAMMEEYLLFARLASQRSVREHLPLGFVRISGRGTAFALANGARHTWSFVEVVPDQETPEQAQALQRNARRFRIQARDADIRCFEYHLVGNNVPKLWLKHLRECFSDAHLKVFWRQSWDVVPTLLVDHDSENPVFLHAKALERLPESLRFREAFQSSLATVKGFEESDLHEIWKTWIGQIAEKHPEGLAVLTQLQKWPLSSLPKSATLLESMLPHDQALTEMLSLPGAPLRALKHILAWKDVEAMLAFFFLFYETEQRALLKKTLQAYADLQDLGVCDLEDSLQKTLSDSLKNLNQDNHWKGNLDGWLFAARQIQESARGLNPWRRATIEADIGSVASWSEKLQKSVMIKVIADIFFEYEAYDAIVEYKAMMRLTPNFLRQAKRYADCLKNRHAKTGRPQVMRYYFVRAINAPTLDFLERTFEGVPLEIYVVDCKGNKVKFQR